MRKGFGDLNNKATTNVSNSGCFLSSFTKLVAGIDKECGWQEVKIGTGNNLFPVSVSVPVEPLQLYD